jgi:hypothetical protein
MDDSESQKVPSPLTPSIMVLPEVAARQKEMMEEQNKRIKIPLKEAYKEPKEYKKNKTITQYWGGQIGTILYELAKDVDGNVVFVEIPKEVPKESRGQFLTTVKEIKRDDETLVPPKRVPFNLPLMPMTWDEVLDPSLDLSVIGKYIVKYLHSYWTDEEEVYDVLACWITLTYLHECTDVYPQLWIYGPQGSGKTKLLELVNDLCYRGIFSSHITPSVLSQLAEKSSAVLLLDETEGLQYNQDLWSLILTRYRKGQYYYCTDKESGGLIERACWGFTGFAGRDRPIEPLGSRCLLVVAKKQMDVPIFPDTLLAKNIRQDLFKMRIRFRTDNLTVQNNLSHYLVLRTQKDTWDSNNGISPREYNNNNVNSVKWSRIDEIMQACVCIAENVSNVPSVLCYMENRKMEQESEEAGMLDADVIQAIDFYMLENTNNPSSSEIVEIINKGRGEREKIKAGTIGRLMKRLGYKQSNSHGTKRKWIIADKTHTYNRIRFGVADENEVKPKPKQETLKENDGIQH